MFSLARQGWLSILANYLVALFSSLIDPSPSKLTWHSPLSAPPPWRGRRLGIQTNFYLHCGTKRGICLLRPPVLTKCDQCILDQRAGGQGPHWCWWHWAPGGQVTLLCLCSWSLHSPLSGVWTPLKHSPALCQPLARPGAATALSLRSPDLKLSSPLFSSAGSRLPVPGPGQSPAPPAPDPDAATSLVRSPPPGPGRPMGGEQGRKATWRVYSPASRCIYYLGWHSNKAHTGCPIPISQSAVTITGLLDTGQAWGSLVTIEPLKALSPSSVTQPYSQLLSSMEIMIRIPHWGSCFFRKAS